MIKTAVLIKVLIKTKQNLVFLSPVSHLGSERVTEGKKGGSPAGHGGALYWPDIYGVKSTQQQQQEH